MPPKHLILCRPLLLLPSIFLNIRIFSNESALRIRWPKYWSFSFNISPSNKHPGLISFKMDWLDLLVVLETLKSLLQHHSSKASIPLHSAFFIVQLSHPYMTTGRRSSFHKPRQHIKKQRHYFANKSLHSQHYTFSSGHISIWELDHKEGWGPITDAFELWCWRRLLRVLCTARRSNQSILKEINFEYSLEGLMLKLKLQ